ncbi:MAG: response regulator transcription factor [Anaerolineae bacterium]|nr:response regulator transcription factor [Anaerolineae bacterium]
MKQKILVIDDDTGLLTLLRLGLEREGFSVLTAESGKEGLRQAYDARPDLIILDIMMPGMDGWLTCQRLRYVCDTPIIMLTARTGKEDVLKGLSLGADDFLTKPCSFDELKARIRTTLRRAGSNTQEDWRAVYDDGDLYIDIVGEKVARRGTPIHLTPTESRLLMYLVSQRERIVPHEELLVSVWGPKYAEEVGYLSVYIRYLRRKIEDDPANPRYVRTRWGVGYYFAGDGAFQTVPGNGDEVLD